MNGQILEGTWEEIAHHADEFAGKRLRLTVLGDADSPDEKQPEKSSSPPQSLADLLKEHIGAVHGKGLNLAERSEEAFGVILEEKHRKRGLDR
ncbi:MAG: hypothetical protein KY468_04220 [Armatimonadetes bacterium]|nr:hypothetical protein [Armatimonadota bacterium]